MSGVPDRLRAALADRYSIEREVGAGGMATVYLARDHRHDRRVAVKVLRPELAAVLGTERFLAEIRVTANLQHPHILPLFDSGEAEGQLFYVMPFVEGESLRARLDREHQLPVEEAMRLATSIAGGLDYAHRQRVVHRDLKPENVLLHDGQPLIADFGIALAVSNAGGARVTQTGISLGTPAYMSPEQASGDRHVDGRADVYSLAAITYEMLVGDPPHVASTAQALIAKVLTERAPRVRVHRDTVPEHVDVALARALAKLPADRFATAATFAQALSSAAALDGNGNASASAGRRRWRAALSRAQIALAAGAGIAGAFFGSLVAPHFLMTSAPPTWLSIDPPADQFGLRPAPSVSPDGRVIAFWAPNDSGATQLWLRSLEDPNPRPVTGSILEREGAVMVPAFWSPDAKSLGFFAGGKLMRADLSGGLPQALADAPNPRGGTWAPDGTIVFTPVVGGPMFRIDATGGRPIGLGNLSSGSWPHFLPDGRRFLYTRIEPGGERSVYVSDVGRLEERRLFRVQSRVEYVSGRLLYTRDGQLFAHPFDPDRLTFTGDPIRILDRVGSSGGESMNHSFSASETTLVFWPDAADPDTQLGWYDRTGLRTAPPLLVGPVIGLDVSPDARWAAIERVDPSDPALWLVDLSTGVQSLLRAGGFTPVWDETSERLAFGVFGGGIRRLTIASGTEETLAIPRGAIWPRDVTPDGTGILFDRNSPGSARDIMLLSLDGSGSVEPYLATPHDESAAHVSPDGRWVAYVSDESGASEIYVQSFPSPGNKLRVSTEGGSYPKWSPDGSRLYYIAADRTLVEASLTAASGGIRFNSVELFAAPATSDDGGRDVYAVSRDGRFLFNERVTTEQSTTLRVSLNWAAAF